MQGVAKAKHRQERFAKEKRSIVCNGMAWRITAMEGVAKEKHGLQQNSKGRARFRPEWQRQGKVSMATAALGSDLP